MKRHINLFKQQENQNLILQYLAKIKQKGLLALGILAIIVFIEAVAFFFLSRQIQAQELQKSRYNTFIIQNQVFDSKVNYFVFKYGLLKQFLGQDASVSFYHGLLLAFITEVNIPAVLTHFSLNNEQFVEFSLQFDSYQRAIAFMSYIESEKLPDYFENLSLKEFTISNTGPEEYVLEFEGTFKKVTNASQS